MFVICRVPHLNKQTTTKEKAIEMLCVGVFVIVIKLGFCLVIGFQFNVPEKHNLVVQQFKGSSI